MLKTIFILIVFTSIHLTFYGQNDRLAATVADSTIMEDHPFLLEETPTTANYDLYYHLANAAYRHRDDDKQRKCFFRS